MAKETSLQAAYSAMAALKASGTPLTPGAVARAAGLARSTLYLEDDDWVDVLDAIAGKPSARLDAAAPDVRAEPKRLSAIDHLIKRIEGVEAELDGAIEFADSTYQSLIDQLQYYFALAHESPKRREEDQRRRTELIHTLQDLEKAKLEISVLREQIDLSKVSFTSGRKRQLVLSFHDDVGSAANQFLDALHAIIPDSIVGKVYAHVYFVCGAPMSGRTTWIDRHVPLGPGTTLYIEGIFQNRSIRGFIANHIRRLTQAKVHCVWLNTGLAECSRRAKHDKEGRLSIFPAADLEKIFSVLQPVTIDEPFDSIMGVG